MHRETRVGVLTARRTEWNLKSSPVRPCPARFYNGQSHEPRRDDTR